ncbi:MAG TPA: hypothetical protein VGQ39_21830, partial [Pyrinomonadaceae bacterium]|nr:hypothetical protein [Pyrinomonadaceae bacterium]
MATGLIVAWFCKPFSLLKSAIDTGASLECGDKSPHSKEAPVSIALFSRENGLQNQAPISP